MTRRLRDEHASKPAPRQESIYGTKYIAILFDIDRTLIISSGAGAASWRMAFDELYGIPDRPNQKPSGRTGQTGRFFTPLQRRPDRIALTLPRVLRPWIEAQGRTPYERDAVSDATKAAHPNNRAAGRGQSTDIDLRLTLTDHRQAAQALHEWGSRHLVAQYGSDVLRRSLLEVLERAGSWAPRQP